MLLTEVLGHLMPGKGETVADVTVGLGGHSEAFLKAVGESGTLIALDADAENLSDAERRLSCLPGRKIFHHRNFRELPRLRIPPCDIVFADLGVSSPHFDDAERGFSFRFDGPLDLRFDRSGGRTAAELIASLSEEDLRGILSDFGEVRQARTLAAEIFARKPETTQDLRTCVERICGFRAKSVFPQVFQALRMAVNDEEGSLRVLLESGPKSLKPGGRMAVISFHSREDRMVKRTFRALSTPTVNDATGAVLAEANFILLTKKAVRPTEGEMERNPRARSARLRVLRKTP